MMHHAISTFMSICPTLLPCLAAKPSSNPISGFTLCMAHTVRLPNSRSFVRISHILLNPWCDHHKIPGAFPLITIFQPHLLQCGEPMQFSSQPLPIFGGFIHVYTIHFWWLLGITGGKPTEKSRKSRIMAMVVTFSSPNGRWRKAARVPRSHCCWRVCIPIPIFPWYSAIIIPINSHEFHIQSPSF